MKFDIDGTPAQLALSKVAAGMRTLEKEYRNLTKTSTQSDEQIKQQQQMVAVAYAKLNGEKIRLIQLTKQENVEMQGMKGSMSKTSQAIGAMSFAMDDFVTVMQISKDPVDGFIRGMRAASNNISMLLFAINPLYAIIPSLVTAIGGPLLKAFLGTSEEASKMAEVLDANTQKVRDLVTEARNLGRERQDIEDEQKIRDVDETVRNAGVKAAGEQQRAKERADLRISGLSDVLLNMPAAERQKAEERIRQEEGVAAQGAEFDLQQARRAAEAVKQDIAKKRAVRDAETRLKPVEGALQKSLEGLLKSGANPDQAAAAAITGAGLPMDDATKTVVGKMAREAQGRVTGDQLEGEIGKIAVPGQVDLEAAQQKLDDFKKQREEEKLDAKRTGRRLRPREEATKDETQNQLEAVVKSLQEMVEAQKKSGIDTAPESLDVLKKILEALTRRPPNGGGNN